MILSRQFKRVDVSGRGETSQISGGTYDLIRGDVHRHPVEIFSMMQLKCRCASNRGNRPECLIQKQRVMD